MRNRIERLRLWLVAGAVLLLVVLATFIGSARYLKSKFRLGKAASLAANIKSALSNVSYSHTSQGGTEYTIHAASEVDYKDGKIALHDVSMVLYGKKHDRADHIYGKEFEYDQNDGVVRAIGLVHIDMQAAGAMQASGAMQAAGAGSAGGAQESPKSKEATEAKILHATTSGLIYMDKLGVAATGEPIEFQLGAMIGHATGADYSTDSGVLMLHSAVTMNGITDGRLVNLTAGSAELDDHNQQAFLTHATYASMGRTVTADQATVHTRHDGTLARIEAQGNVTSEFEGAKLVSQRGDVLLNAKSQPESALLSGGVTYAADEALRQVRGQATESTVAFDGHGEAQHAVFTGAVHVVERTRATEAVKEPWSVRDLTAARVEVALGPDAKGKAQLRNVDAAGAAHLTLVNEGSLASAKGMGRTDLSADDLKAHLVETGDAKKPVRLDAMTGTGHTSIHQVGPDGAEQTSQGDSLDARFRAPAAGVGKQRANDSVSDLLSAVQQGHVTLLRRTAARPGANGRPARKDDIEHGLADRAVYDGDADRLTLTGSVELSDVGSVVWADKVALDHASGDALAEGAVKVNYVQEDAASGHVRPAAEPTHILAETAEMHHAAGVTTFRGAAGVPVRLWQGGTQVQAPVVEFYQEQRRMMARGEGEGSAGAVHTVLVSSGSSKPAPGKAATARDGAAKPAAKKAGSEQKQPTVVRIASREMNYLDALHEVEFTGGVRVEDGDGVMLAREATGYLRADGAGDAPAKGAGSGAGSGMAMDGRLERVVATGQIDMIQPGRRATGERLDYTQADGLFVLTGGAGTMAKVVDSTRGTTVTGPRLEFHSGDESVTVSGAEGLAGQRVRTDARIKK